MTRRSLDGHPDFVAAPERRRYTGSLHGLFVFLVFEAKAHPGTECWRVLRGGAAVSLRAKPNGKLILRLSRSDRPANDDARAKWESECATFLQHFGAPARWHRVPDLTASGVATHFHEEEPGVRCQCGGLIDPGLLPLATSCEECAVATARGTAGAR